MSLEEALDRNTKALESLSAQLAKGGSVGSAAPAAETGEKKPPGRPKSVTIEQVKAIAEKIRDTEGLGRPAAVALIKQHGADSIAEMEKSKYSQFIAAAEVLLNKQKDGGEEAAEDEPNEEL